MDVAQDGGEVGGGNSGAPGADAGSAGDAGATARDAGSAGRDAGGGARDAGVSGGRDAMMRVEDPSLLDGGAEHGRSSGGDSCASAAGTSGGAPEGAAVGSRGLGDLDSDAPDPSSSSSPLDGGATTAE